MADEKDKLTIQNHEQAAHPAPKTHGEISDADLEKVSGGDLSLNFTKIEVQYTPQKAD